LMGGKKGKSKCAFSNTLKFNVAKLVIDTVISYVVHMWYNRHSNIIYSIYMVLHVYNARTC